MDNKIIEPEISIIVPVYKVEKYLEKCINSILAQTFKNFELILVNDGSPDKCGEICNKYAKLDSRIKVIHKENGGLSSARNAGLDVAKGKYIGFVDSDDYINKEMYSRLKEALEQNKSDIAICRYKEVGSFESSLDKILILNYKIKNYDSIQVFKEFYTVNYPIFVVAWNKLYKRELFDEIRYPINRINEDAFIAHELIYKAKQITYIDDKLYYYYQREDSIMRAKFSMKNLDKIYYNIERIKFFKKIKQKELLDSAVTVFVNNFFNSYYRVKYQLKIEKKMLKKIKKLFISNYINVLKSRKLNYKEKLFMLIFIINDNCYLNYSKK